MPSTRKAKHFRPQNVLKRNVSKSKRNVSDDQSNPKTTTKRLKRAGTALESAIRLANLVPKGADLPDCLVDTDLESRAARGPSAFPTMEELEGAIGKLPSGLSAYLIDSLHDPNWSALGNSAQVHRIANLYERICSDGAAIRRVIQLSQAQEIGYLRECKNEDCRKIFFAGRSDKYGCSDPCLAKLRKKTWKDNQKKYQVERDLKEANEERKSKKAGRPSASTLRRP